MSSAQQLNEQGNALVQAGKFKDAIAKYQAAIEMDPEQTAFHSNLAHCYFKLTVKRWPEQEAAARQCLAIDAAFIKGYYRLAAALKMKNKYDEAIEVLKQCLKINPSNFELKLLLSEVLLLVKINGCAFCGAMNAPKVCSFCSKTYYCTQVCQREHWPVHKTLCIKSPECGVGTCTSCLKLIRSTDIVYCDKCGVETYCSTSCRNKSRSEHQPKCKGEQIRTMDKIHKLFLKYFDSSCCTPVHSLATYAMTREQFMDPDPPFVICIMFRFHPNYGSFVPKCPPVTVKVDHLSEYQLAEFIKAKQKVRNVVPENHFGHSLMVINELPNGEKVLAFFRHSFYEPSGLSEHDLRRDARTLSQTWSEPNVEYCMGAHP